jgi:hypothetical protein
MRANQWIVALAVSTAAWLSACGGGGGSSTTVVNPVDSGTATVGAAGGTVTTQSGAAKAVFPANALAANTTVTIAAASGPPANARMISGTAYDFGPSGSLAQPVQVTLRYDPTKLPSGSLQSKLAIYKAVSGAWVAVPNSVVDSVAYTVTAPLTSFSIYAILVNNQFEGAYAGTYTSPNPAFSGTWNATINADGSLTATATGGFTGSGGVGFAGGANISLGGSGTTPGATIAFAGSFNLVGNGVTGSGTWSSNFGDTGTWAGSRVP